MKTVAFLAMLGSLLVLQDKRQSTIRVNVSKDAAKVVDARLLQALHDVVIDHVALSDRPTTRVDVRMPEKGSLWETGSAIAILSHPERRKGNTVVRRTKIWGLSTLPARSPRGRSPRGGGHDDSSSKMLWIPIDDELEVSRTYSIGTQRIDLPVEDSMSYADTSRTLRLIPEKLTFAPGIQAQQIELTSVRGLSRKNGRTVIRVEQKNGARFICLSCERTERGGLLVVMVQGEL